MTFALAITHTPWIEDRVRSMDRLRKALLHEAPLSHLIEAKEFTERMPNFAWAHAMWSWASHTHADHALFLQDDVVVAPMFWQALEAMVEAYPGEVLGLESVHPGGRMLARAGGRWYTTSDGLIGVGYVMPVRAVKDFLVWQRNELVDGAQERITEDGLINVWCLSTRRRIFHPVPTIIDHDVSIPSSYRNDLHAFRKPSVIWSDGDICNWTEEDLTRRDFWDARPAHLGRFYAGTYWLCRHYVKTWTESDHARAEQDVCPQRVGKWITI